METGIPAVVSVTCWFAILALALVWISGAMED